MMIPQPFVEQLGHIVAATEKDILACLQEVDKGIKTLNYQYGPAEQIKETMNQFDKSPTKRFMKYPLIFLLTPFQQPSGQSGGYYDKVTCSIGIAFHSQKGLKSYERYEKNIKGILLPIYNSLMEHIVDSGYFAVTTVRGLKNTPIIRDDIGRKPFMNIEGAVYDYIDAIEIINLELTRDYPDCLTTNCNC